MADLRDVAGPLIFAAADWDGAALEQPTGGDGEAASSTSSVTARRSSDLLAAEMNYMLSTRHDRPAHGFPEHLGTAAAGDTDPITSLRMAALKAENTDRAKDVVVVHTADWATIETTRNTSGPFDLGSAVDRAPQKV